MNSTKEFFEKTKFELVTILFGYCVLVGFIYNYTLFNVNLEFNIFDYMNTNDIIFSWIVDPYIMTFIIIFGSAILLNIFPFVRTLIISLFITGTLIPLIYKLNFIFIYTDIVFLLFVLIFHLKSYSKRCVSNIGILISLISGYISVYLYNIWFPEKLHVSYIDIIFLFSILVAYFLYTSIFIKKYKDIKNNYFINLVNLFSFQSFDEKETMKFKKKHSLRKIVTKYNEKLIELEKLAIVHNKGNLYSKIDSFKLMIKPIEEIEKLIEQNNTIYFKTYEDYSLKLLKNLYKIIELEYSFETEVSGLIIDIKDELNEIKEIVETNLLVELSIPIILFLFTPMIAGSFAKKVIENDTKNIVQIKFIKDSTLNKNESNRLCKVYKITSNFTIVKICDNECLDEKKVEKKQFTVFNNTNISSMNFIDIIEFYKLDLKKGNKEFNLSNNQNISESINNESVNSLNNYLISDDFGIKIGNIIIPQINSLLDTKFDLTANFDKLLEYNKSGTGIYFKYNGKLKENEKIYFDEILFNIDDKADKYIRELLKDIKSENKYVINLTGNADLKGISLRNKTIKDNYTLSLARANSVKNHIIKVLVEQKFDIQNVEFNIHGNSNQNINQSKKDKDNLQRYVEIDILEFILYNKN